MARLPKPGADSGTWGDILNDYLSQVHKADGTLQDNAVTANVLAPNSVSNAAIASNAVNAASIADGSITEALLDNAVQTKLNLGTSSPDWSAITNKPAVIAAGADQTAARAAIGAGTASTKSDVGLGNVDNTSDTAKPISTATQTALDGKQPRFLTGTSGTAVGTAAKAVTLDSPWASYTPVAGDWLLITLTNGQNAGGPTLSVNGGAAITIATLTGSTSWQYTSVVAGGQMLLYYNGTVFRLMNPTEASGEISDAEIVNATDSSPRFISGRRAETLMANEAAKARTLTNKTLTSPKADGIKDTNGNTALSFTATTSAVNFMQVQNSGTGASVGLSAQGSDTNVGLSLYGKGTGAINLRTGGGASVLVTSADTTPVNYLVVAAKATGTGPQITATGSDTNVDLNLNTKGTGVVKVNGTQILDTSSAQTLTNKTLTDPKINRILDSNGNTVVDTVYNTSAVNYLRLSNQPTGFAPSIGVAGSDSNIALTLAPKGTGIINIYTASGTNPAIAAQGVDTNLDLKLQSKGTGNVVVKQNGDTAFRRVATMLTTPPATATSTGIVGQLAYDANYFYICTATNTWKRTALSSSW